MTEVIIRNQTYHITPTRDSFNRRAVQYTNSIIEKFKSIGLTVDDVTVSEERMAIKRAPASVSWWINNSHCHFSYNKMTKYVDNLLVVLRVIERHVNELVAENISIEEFLEIFEETKDIEEQRAKAREFFELDENHIDLDIINKKYKILAKTLHPDMSTGDLEKFKELNRHHKILKRELE